MSGGAGGHSHATHPSDPIRESGGRHTGRHVQRGVAEFLRLPLVITVLFCAAGVAVAILDAAADESAPLRGLARSLVPGSDAIDFVSAVATSILTVTSITFSVLLLAVQQTATSLTAVVFDQFLRRVTNQIYVGFFIGLSAYSFIVLGAARDNPPPVYGAALMMVLTVAALVVLLLLIHGTVDQMRPQSVVRSIHALALQARQRELVLLGRTLAHRRTDPAGGQRRVRARDNGYVVGVDVDALAGIADSVGPDAEILVQGTLGRYLMYGTVIAIVAGVSEDDDTWDDDVIRAFRLDDVRDVEIEAGYATDQLENICWCAGSSAHQSPQTAIAAARALGDLLARWLDAGERDRSRRADQPEPAPVVYEDGAVGRVALPGVRHSGKC